MCFDSHLPKLYFGVDHGQNAVIEWSLQHPELVYADCSLQLLHGTNTEAF